MIGEFRSVLCVPVFQGSLLVIVVMIDSSEKCNDIVKAVVFLKSTVNKYSRYWELEIFVTALLS